MGWLAFIGGVGCLVCFFVVSALFGIKCAEEEYLGVGPTNVDAFYLYWCLMFAVVSAMVWSYWGSL